MATKHLALLTTTMVATVLSSCAPLNTTAPTPVSAAGPTRYKLPMSTIFKGEDKFHAIVRKAQRENWRALPIGERTMRVAREMVGTRYVNYTLEVDDHIEAPVVNFHEQDCWTFYENALAISRMIHYQHPPYTPTDMLRMVELERYRHGRCDGSYLSRMHHLEEVFHDNQRRGLATNVTRQIPGAERIRRNIAEMTVQWKNYRYLRNNPSLLKPMASIEKRVSRLPVYHIPKTRVRGIEKHLRNGDICAITSKYDGGYTSHVGLILKRGDRAWFVHATSARDKGRRVVIDAPITNYLYSSSKHAGIIICRPKDLPSPTS